MDEKSIQDHRRAWQRLWQMAQAESERQEPQEPRSSPDPMDTDENPRVQSFLMSLIETACLEFCIELLNQKIRVHEYESPLVCAMAVLGWGRNAWRDPDTYTPILSRVLKVARFMVVQKALWLDPAVYGYHPHVGCHIRTGLVDGRCSGRRSGD
ncbi:uncharacterized protein BDW70DRAFT_145904, partial [Aspergillus foveolatus]|uniref:uncharacterized protein n=1 Tax=Aspergillus foveolatus TaxID=210207 RepID=UPI003CCD271B